MPKQECNWCGETTPSKLKRCSKCGLVDYCSIECQKACWKSGHKILCSKLPNLVTASKSKIELFSLDQYTTQPCGTFMVTEAQAQRGCLIIEESTAQDMCYDAWEMPEGSVQKLVQLMKALAHFPLSVEAWSNLGNYYHREMKSHKIFVKECAAKGLDMFDTAIACARILNPTWSANRTEELSWGEIDNRPYLRAIASRASALHDVGNTAEAVKQAKLLLRWNPNDNQGTRKLLCTWYLEMGNTEGCTNLLRKFDTKDDTTLAYTDVLLQFLRWKNDDAVEKEVQQALYVAVYCNSHIPDVLTAAKLKHSKIDSYSPGSIVEAKMYAQYSWDLWKTYPDALQWLASQKFMNGQSKPSNERDIISLLKSGIDISITCSHTNFEGRSHKVSTIIGTQRRKRCIGSGLADFFWPPQLNRDHCAENSDIFIHDNDWEKDYPRDGRSRWRKTKYSNITEVPYWGILLKFQGENLCGEDDSDDDNNEELILDDEVLQETLANMRVRDLDRLGKKCKHCESTPTLSVLGDDGCHFYCTGRCMNKDFAGSSPLSFELESPVLKITRPDDASPLSRLDIDLVLAMANKFMPNIIGVDIFIDQQFVLEGVGHIFDLERKKSLILSSNALQQFLNQHHSKLESFRFRLDECIGHRVAEMIDNGKAFAPLATMPNLAKLELSNLQFSDINTLNSCIFNTNLKVLCLDYIAIKMSGMPWSSSDWQALMGKIYQMESLVSLSLEDSAISDEDLNCLLPRLTDLKCLSLSGSFVGNQPHDMHSLLTDKGLGYIAEHCKNLQSLVVHYQRRASVKGIKRIVQNCPHLVSLAASDIEIPTEDIKRIVKSSKKLLFLSIKSLDLQAVDVVDTVNAVRGRTCIHSTYQGLLQFNLSPIYSQNQQLSKQKMEEAWEKKQDPRVYNEFEGF